jgi:predicted permease
MLRCHGNDTDIALLAALGPVTSVIALIALGYAPTRLKVRTGVDGLGTFVLYVAIPALLSGGDPT